MWHSYFKRYMSLPNIIKLSQIVWELWPAQDFGFKGDNYITKKVSVVSLAQNNLLVILFIPTKYYQLSQTVLELWPAQDFGLRWDNYIRKKSESCLFCIWHTYWSSSSFLPNIIKICPRYQTYGAHKDVSRFLLQGRQQHNEESELSLLHVTCPPVLLFIPTKYYQIISNSMGLLACTRFQLQGR